MPWVPRDLYELMLDALRETRASVAFPVPSGISAAAAVEPAPAPKHAPVAAAVETVALPDAVLAACERYSFGDQTERLLNLQRAVEMQSKGLKPMDIVNTIRMGASPDALWIG